MKPEGQDIEQINCQERKDFKIRSIRFTFWGFILLVVWGALMLTRYISEANDLLLAFCTIILFPSALVLGVLGIIYDKIKWPALLLILLTSIPIIIVVYVVVDIIVNDIDLVPA